ncbi:MAG: hypothetical protein ACKEQK_00065 [Candidatus Hodgkinia cicadicola]
MVKGLNNLILSWMEQFIMKALIVTKNHKRIIRQRSIANTTALSSILLAGSINIPQLIRYKSNWTKVIKNNKTIVGATDVTSTCSCIEGLQFEITKHNGDVLVKVMINKAKGADTVVKLYAFQTANDQRIVTFDRNLIKVGLNDDAYSFEVSINAMDFMLIRSSELLRIESSNFLKRDITLIDFEINKLNNVIKTKVTPEQVSKALNKQTLFQRSLLFNLTYKTKEYTMNPNISQDLNEQFEGMKAKLINEINDPNLLNPKP